MANPGFSFEKKLWLQGHKYIIGLDEVGRGALAGPVVVGAVVFPPTAKKLEGITDSAEKSKRLGIKIKDSKQLTALQREKADGWIRKNALACSTASLSAKTVDRLGIVKATHSGFRRVVKSIQEQLGHPVNFVLIDAFYIPKLRAFPLLKNNRRQLAIIDGDAKCFTIASASIVAKVYRDGLMKKLGERKKYQKYGWEKNKGYGTKFHQEAIKKYGVTSYHRKSFIHLTT